MVLSIFYVFSGFICKKLEMFKDLFNKVKVGGYGRILRFRKHSKVQTKRQQKKLSNSLRQ